MNSPLPSGYTTTPVAFGLRCTGRSLKLMSIGDRNTKIRINVTMTSYCTVPRSYDQKMNPLIVRHTGFMGRAGACDPAVFSSVCKENSIESLNHRTIRVIGKSSELEALKSFNR